MKMFEGQAKRKFPLFVDLGSWRILVVGGGKIARRRVETLLEFDPGHITVVAVKGEQAFKEWAKRPNVSFCERPYSPDDLEGCQMALAATDDGELNRKIGEECRKRGILVNVASEKELCDFHFPGIAMKGPVTVGVNAAGTDHKLARKTREEIQAFLDGEAVCKEKSGRSL